MSVGMKVGIPQVVLIMMGQVSPVLRERPTLSLEERDPYKRKS